MLVGRAGWLASRRNAGKFQNLKLFALFNKRIVQRYYSSTNGVKLVFSAKVCYKVVFKSVKNPEAIHFHNDPYY